MIPLKDNVPTSRPTYVTYALIAVNVAVFILQMTAGADQQYLVDVEGHRLLLNDGFNISVWRFGLRPAEIVHWGTTLAPPTPIPEWATFFTSMFMHGGFLHIAGNMLYLWIFGNNIEDALGPVRFLAFYLLAGLAAAGAQIAVNSDSVIPMVGASGAIAGVMGGYLLLHPHARVLTLVPIFYFIRIMEIPAVFFLGFWILIQVISSGSEGGTAWFAHIGGFVFGLATIKLFVKYPQRPPRQRPTIHRLYR